MKAAHLFLRALVVSGGALLPLPLQAQSVDILRPGGILPAGITYNVEPADRLATSLRMLAQNPYDVSALTQAGESALAVGDANAAISFLARAEELAPANGRIKASLASALVLVERPADSFRLFSDAVALGVPEYQVAKDRGLAFDLTGDGRRAQRDYNLSLKHGVDDEVIRRLALSLGISGDREQALRQLEPLLRKQDQASWRARAFILAMTGDVRGAELIAEQVAPPTMVAGLSTFMRRLAILTPAQRAAAVNFGSMPGNQMQMAVVQQGDLFRPIGEGASSSLTPVSNPTNPVAVTMANSIGRGSSEPRRRPGRDSSTAPRIVSAPLNAAPSTPIPAPVPNSGPSWSDRPSYRRDAVKVAVIAAPPSQSPNQSARQVELAPRPALFEIPAPSLAPPVKREVAEAPVRVEPKPEVVDAIVTAPAIQEIAPRIVSKAPDTLPPAPGFADGLVQLSASTPPAAEVSAKAAAETVVEPIVSSIELVRAPIPDPPAPEPVALPPAPQVQTQVSVAEPIGLVSILAGITPEQESSGGRVLSDTEFRKARLAVMRKASAETAAALEADAQAKDAAERKRVANLQPERIWVQVATGSNRAGLIGTLSRLRDKAPDALKGVSGATAPFKATNRVLVGPFKSQAEARAVVNKLSKQGIAATSWTSIAGQEVAKLPSR